LEQNNLGQHIALPTAQFNEFSLSGAFSSKTIIFNSFFITKLNSICAIQLAFQFAKRAIFPQSLD